MDSRPSILVLGIGNYLLGDEGVGVHAIRGLQAEILPADVRLLDGGTGGFHLLAHLQEHRSVILIDATMDGKPAGTVTVLAPRFASDFPPSLSAHDIGLRDLIESAMLLGHLPPIQLIAVSIDRIQPMSTDLSPAVEHALPGVCREVRHVLAEIQHRDTEGSETHEGQLTSQ